MAALPSDDDFESNHVKQIEEFLRLDGFFSVLGIADESVPGPKNASQDHLVDGLFVSCQTDQAANFPGGVDDDPIVDARIHSSPFRCDYRAVSFRRFIKRCQENVTDR